MDRLAVTVLVWALLVATTCAFVVTEALKLERPPVGQMRGDRAFSPTCSCPKQVAELSFRLRRADTIDVAIVDEGGTVVRTLATTERRSRGRARFRWDGRNEADEIAQDGAYRLRVRLSDADRTVTFSRRVNVDTEPPQILLLAVEPQVAATADEISLRVELSEPARVFAQIEGRRPVRFGLIDAGRSELDWAAALGGRRLPPGRYSLSLTARDPAGNRSAPMSEPLELEIAGSR